MAQDPLYLDINSLASLADLFRVVEEPECSKVRFAENVNLRKYIEKSYRGNILPYNNWTQRMLRLEEIKLRLPSLTNAGDVDDLVQRLNSANTFDEEQSYSAGIIIQLVTRLLTFSLQFRRSLSAVPKDRLTSALSAVSDYHSAVLDLSNPFTTLPWKVLENDFLEKAQNMLQLPFNPYSDPSGDMKAVISGASPFVVTGGAIQPLDTTVSFVENLYRQAAGQFKSFDKSVHSDATFTQFGFKEYVRHKIPMKRVINGAYICYADPLNKTYYYTTLTFDPFRFKMLKNLIIYEIVSGKAAYIHSALHLFMSMCTCEEDFRLMIEYGIIQWGFPMEGYTSFCEKMKELLDVMYCWKFTNTWTWHTELVKIALFKDSKGDTSGWNDFATTCYTGGLLKAEVTVALFKSLC
ncbi:19515_t:CDS:2 [Funneliformis geosporum]|nr:19515_t:CDS:2 [Funneliformis geosporum]